MQMRAARSEGEVSTETGRSEGRRRVGPGHTAHWHREGRYGLRAHAAAVIHIDGTGTRGTDKDAAHTAGETVR